MPWWLYAMIAIDCMAFLLLAAVQTLRRAQKKRKAPRGQWLCPRCGQPFGAEAAKQSWDFKSIGPPPGSIGIDCPRCGLMVVNHQGEFLFDPRDPFARE